MNIVCTTAQIRAAEQPLIEGQKEPDGYMRQAARAVAEVAKALQQSLKDARILVLAGSGGNGGDGLYAGALLAGEGARVEAVLLGRDGKVHEPALAAFEESGGVVVPADEVGTYDLVIDAILGIGARGGLDARAAHVAAGVGNAPFLCVDTPSGIDADTGATPPPLGNGTPAFCQGTATVTFGALRRVHAISPFCGDVYCAPVTATTSMDGVEQDISIAQACAEAVADTYMGWDVPSSAHEWPITTQLAVQRHPDRAAALAAHGIESLEPSHAGSLEPRVYDNKYSGVTGIIAGSDTYPGAAILATSGAVHATSAMVRYAGTCHADIVRALPEVVATARPEDAGRCQAWVYGPGVGAISTAALLTLLTTATALIIDADGITQLAASTKLQEALMQRAKRGQYTLLTPHDGEFTRLAQAIGGVRDVDKDRLGAVCDMVDALGCAILLKGRITIVAGHGHIYTINAGHSWLATPGSGDVLAGILGAWTANFVTVMEEADMTHGGLTAAGPDACSILTAAATFGVGIHATAGWLAAHTPYGPAPTTASTIAQAIPAATAALNNDAH